MRAQALRPWTLSDGVRVYPAVAARGRGEPPGGFLVAHFVELDPAEAVGPNAPVDELAGLMWWDSDGTIRGLSVQEKHRRRGIGTHLLRTAAECHPALHSHDLTAEARALRDSLLRSGALDDTDSWRWAEPGTAE